MALDTLKKNIEEADKKAMEVRANAGACAKKIGASAVEAKCEKSEKSEKPEKCEKSEKSKKTVEELAQEVIRGLWGNGVERKERLTEAGYDYDAVQKCVSKLLG